MFNNKINELKERWTKQIDYEFNKSLQGIDWKDKTKPNIKLSQSPFGLTENGKIDLRHLKLREGLQYQYFKDVDLSYFEPSIFNPQEIRKKDMYISKNKVGVGIIINSIFEDCLFRHATIPNISELFINCDFTYANFSSIRVSGVFKNCNFDNASFNNIIFGTVIFENCSFQKTKFKKCLLTNSKWHNCNLSGTIFQNGFLSKNDFNLSEFINSPLTEKQITDINSNIKVL